MNENNTFFNALRLGYYIHLFSMENKEFKKKRKSTNNDLFKQRSKLLKLQM